MNLLLKFAFNYAPNKLCLKFIGVAVLVANQHTIEKMLRAEILSLALVQCAVRACFRTDKDTREVFDTPPFGVFMTEYNYNSTDEIAWENRLLSNKIEKALYAKEMYTLKNMYHVTNLFVTDSDKKKTYQLSVFNNNGLYLQNTRFDWDTIDICKLISDFRDFSNQLRSTNPDEMNQQISDILEFGMEHGMPIDFVKKCIYFCITYMQRLNMYNIMKYNDMVRIGRYLLVSILHKHESVTHVSRWCLAHLFDIYNDCERQDYIKDVLNPKAQRLIQSKKKCQTMKKEISSKDSKDNYAWRCLLCNTFNEYSKYNDGCPTCRWDEIYVGKLCSVSPLWFVEENKSISFGVDPRDKPFYIIGDFSIGAYDCNDESKIVNNYGWIQAMIKTI